MFDFFKKKSPKKIEEKLSVLQKKKLGTSTQK